MWIGPMVIDAVSIQSEHDLVRKVYPTGGRGGKEAIALAHVALWGHRSLRHMYVPTNALCSEQGLWM
jgi:hypothetical protein